MIEPFTSAKDSLSRSVHWPHSQVREQEHKIAQQAAELGVANYSEMGVSETELCSFS